MRPKQMGSQAIMVNRGVSASKPKLWITMLPKRRPSVDKASNVAEKATVVVPGRELCFINAHDVNARTNIVAGVEIDVYCSYDV